MLKRVLFCLGALLAVGAAQPSTSSPDIMPLKDIRAGMRGVGRTAFEGDKIQEFGVKILGVLPNMGPRQAVILAQLSGGPLADTAVLAGMSGSPVYVDGKLIGAVALGWPFSKTALAGITPIEQMMSQADQAAARKESPDTGNGLELTAASGRLEVLDPAPSRSAAAPRNAGADLGTLPQLHTPLVLGGFTTRAIEHFMPQLEALGLDPMQGGSAGGTAELKTGVPSDLHPGDMISVQLLRGDLNVAADGTVTAIRDGHIYAFGHPFLSTGSTAMPFAKAKVLALMSGVMSSFKISIATESLGVVQQDLSQGIYGSFGGHANMIPVRLNVHAADGQVTPFRFEMVDHRFLSPLLLNLAVFSTLDATQRKIGPSTVALKGAIHVQNAADIQLDNVFAGDVNGPASAALSVATPMAYLYSSGLDDVHVKSIDLDVYDSEQKQLLTLQQAWSDRREVAPGGHFEVTAVLRAPDGTELAKRIPVRLPESLPDGPLHILIGDGNALNQMEMRQLQQGFEARSLPQLVRAINHVRRNNQLYLRVLASDPGFVLQGQQLPDPPPSLARALRSDPAMDVEAAPMPSSTLLDYESAPLPYMIAGNKNLTVMVKSR